MKRFFLCLCTFLLAWLAWLGPAHAGDWPQKNIRLMVPYAPGGGADTIARLIGSQLAQVWKVSVIVENKSGANGVIGSQDVAKSAPDGYAIMLVVGSHIINPVLMKSMPFDAERDFTAITRLATSPMVLAVAADGPFQDLPGFIQALRERPISLGYSEGQTQLTGELLRQATGGKVNPIAYRGGAPLMVDIIGGHVDAGFTSIITALPHVQSGKLRVIGIAGEQPSPIFPQAHTFASAGLPQVQSLNWYGIFGPKNLPEDIVQAITQGLSQAAQNPDIVQQLHSQGGAIAIDGPQAFQAFLRSEQNKWAEVAKNGNIQPQ